jgi:hypothetical protein
MILGLPDVLASGSSCEFSLIAYSLTEQHSELAKLLTGNGVLSSWCSVSCGVKDNPKRALLNGIVFSESDVFHLTCLSGVGVDFPRLSPVLIVAWKK